MNLLIHGRFDPSVGGIETVLRLLVTEWQRAGENVIVVSDVACERPDLRRFPFAVQYRPSPRSWIKLARWADAFVHMNLSLRALWPRFLVCRPFIAVHHGFYYSDSVRRERDWRERLKLRLLRHSINIAVSESIAMRLPAKSVVIPNPFDDSIFHMTGRGESERELIFVGRLVSEKGAELLLRALDTLRERGLRPRLTVVGDGPESERLDQLALCLGLVDQIVFTGACPAQQVSALLRRHSIVVVPSLCDEGFGVVALEGAACGCVVLGSDGGGLPEAIGPAGLIFRQGDLGDLASKLAHLLLHPQEWNVYRQAARTHLVRHHAACVAGQYLCLLRQIVGVGTGSADASSAVFGVSSDANEVSNAARISSSSRRDS